MPTSILTREELIAMLKDANSLSGMDWPPSTSRMVDPGPAPVLPVPPRELLPIPAFRVTRRLFRPRHDA